MTSRPRMSLAAAACGFAMLFLPFPSPLVGQAISSGEIRPFVTGLIPIVGRSGAVGGINVDAAGVIARSTSDQSHALRDARLAAVARSPSRGAATSALRKISLRGLQEALRRLQQDGGPYDEELQNLAGLTRAEYVFLDPEHNDILLAGPAEPWHIDAQGQTVGRKSGLPPVQLDDLLVALRTAKDVATGRGISCSIDPTEAGLQKLAPLLRTRKLNEAVVNRLEQALGEQSITITGVPAGSHFARVLVAADFSMKRLGMNFEPSPIKEFTSYLERLQDPAAPPPRNSIPRWWMAPAYEPLLADESGRAWRLRGQAVQTLSEAGFLDSRAPHERPTREDQLAKAWAEDMTRHYEGLAFAMPAFAELRHCMDLAVIAALFIKEDLPAKARCDLSLLLDAKQFPVAEYEVPRKVASQASLVRKGNSWIVSLSGGVQVDSWSVVQRVEVSDELVAQQKQAVAARRSHWWWD